MPDSRTMPLAVILAIVALISAAAAQGTGGLCYPVSKIAIHKYAAGNTTQPGYRSPPLPLYHKYNLRV